MKQLLIKTVEEKANELRKMAKDIWSNPELGEQELYASKLQRDYMKENGFLISLIENVPTAFVAEYGNEGSVVGVLGEYDALPGLSQLEGVAFKAPTESENPNGHGCGHNLLGVAGIGACLAIKEAIDNGSVKCRVRYYGCPAEEALKGKGEMANEGVFDDLDFSVTFHPFDRNAVWGMGTPAVVAAEFNFKGVTAHAGFNPEVGRSALDAVELMNVGCNYLREHMTEGSRVHYTITNGGEAPNIVPDKASSKYNVRSETNKNAETLFERVVKIANGAAMMTETEVEVNIQNKCYDYAASEVLIPIANENLKWAGPLEFTEEDKKLGKELADTVNQELVKQFKTHIGLENDQAMSEKEVHIMSKRFGGSSDIGDVSYIVPTICLSTSCAPVGVAPHTWQSTSCYGSDIGFKGMLYASKSMAGIIYDVCNNPSVLKEAKRYHEEKGLKFIKIK